MDMGQEGKLTLGDACRSKLEVAIGLLKGVEDVGIGPVWEELLDGIEVRAVLLAQLAHIVVIFIETVGRLFAIGPSRVRAAPAKAAPAATAAASATRGRRRRSGYLGRHGWNSCVVCGLSAGGEEGGEVKREPLV